MNPIALLSVDANPDYLFCLPIAATTWASVGFRVHVALVNDAPLALVQRWLGRVNASWERVAIDRHLCPLNRALPSQCARLYIPGTFVDSSQYVILSDADMLIGSSFLYRGFGDINVFGHDLTGHSQIPICYVGMTVAYWRQVIDNTNSMLGDIRRDLARYCDLSSRRSAWFADQAILTARLKSYGYEKVHFIDRGYIDRKGKIAIGRWDRAREMVRPKGIIHDVHLMRRPYTKENTQTIVGICSTIHPTREWDWIFEYRDEFIRSFGVDVDASRDAYSGRRCLRYRQPPRRKS